MAKGYLVHQALSEKKHIFTHTRQMKIGTLVMNFPSIILYSRETKLNI